MAETTIDISVDVRRMVAEEVEQRAAGLKVRLARIAEAHSKHVDGHGGTDGLCNECGWMWPCATYVWATTERGPLDGWDPRDDEPVPAPVASPDTQTEEIDNA